MTQVETQEDPLEEEMAIYSNILAWRISEMISIFLWSFISGLKKERFKPKFVLSYSYFTYSELYFPKMAAMVSPIILAFLTI